MKDIDSVLNGAFTFLEKVFHALYKDGIDVKHLEIDHICYRVETVERYIELKKKLVQFGVLLGEHTINGRAISTFKLHEPIVFKDKKIPCIELPSPHISKFFPEGFEHIEIVLKDEFTVFMKKHLDIVFETKDMNKALNADIYIPYDGFVVKFHNLSLEEVIKIENKEEKKK